MAENPEDDGARMSFKDAMSYGDYLSLDPILGASKPLSTAHDEMLFIIQHQTSELWMRLALHELDAARTALTRGDFPPVFKMLTRVARIFEQLNNAWDVLRTMTPSDYTEFREDLGQSSGFQSHQYRLIEYILGNRNTAMMRVHEHRVDLHRMLTQELTQPSLYDVAVARLGEALGRDLPSGALDTPHVAQPAIEDAWAQVYRDPEAQWTLYELAEKLVDLEDYFRRWRFNHVTTVERVIGFKRGTGGTSGVAYLRRMLEVELFPELWNVRGQL
ncbi:tryptophan 2,3-dioxygenase [Rhodobacteraceae bacterium N5(2021)]|uniref:Tryptophan 2,3-dioxygenase n=1 Tax=Gymnodinialimonas phycosphaerae TaxID=2841589 RepID=A0A975TVT0_9RHOB|nr:tryptophan 2,3-dioxygenase family protein [Gymnodinialimonas phycosphaerae]MBY4891862.1 tryptophan 2,3-dioxygenase [Gymnodinialimonas phycosphaerae]